MSDLGASPFPPQLYKRYRLSPVDGQALYLIPLCLPCGCLSDHVFELVFVGDVSFQQSDGAHRSECDFSWYDCPHQGQFWPENLTYA